MDHRSALIEALATILNSRWSAVKSGRGTSARAGLRAVALALADGLPGPGCLLGWHLSEPDGRVALAEAGRIILPCLALMPGCDQPLLAAVRLSGLRMADAGWARGR